VKVNQATNEVEMSDDFQQSNFGLEFNSKIARMLSEQIYSDPILAVVREYTCNAWDAHTMVGTADKPVLITLPNPLAPIWSVRDYGPGMALAQIMGTKENGYRGLFNTYGKSGKDDSNTQIGGFGMGSKAGFAYVKQGSAFSVTSWHEGSKHTYTAHMDAKGIPNIVLLSSEVSDEPSGILIEIPVKSGDVGTFLDRTKKVCTYCVVQPEFIGNHIVIDAPEIILEGTGWKALKPVTTYQHGSSIVMGGIAYPIERQHFSGYVLHNGTFLIDAPIGAVELSLSRESLSYDPDTISYIQDRLNQIEQDYVKQAQEKFKALPTRWQKEVFAYKAKANRMLFGDQFSEKGRVYGDRKLEAKSPTLPFRKSVTFAIINLTQYNKTLGKSINFANKTIISRTPEVILVWFDPAKVKNTSAARIHKLYKDTAASSKAAETTIVIVKTTGAKEFLQARCQLGWPDNVIKLEDIEPDESVVASEYVKPTDLKRTISKFTGDGSSVRYYNRQCISSAEIDFAISSAVLYVPVLDGHVCKSLDYNVDDGVPYNEFARLITNLGRSDITQVYCVPKQYKKYVENNPNFTNFVDKVKEQLQVGLSRKVLVQAAAHTSLTDCEGVNDFLANYRSALITVPAFKETNFYKQTNLPKGKSVQLKSAWDKYNTYKPFLEHFGVLPPLPELRLKKGVDMGTYPMLKLVKDKWRMAESDFPVLVDYIKRCEKGTETNV
jgi:hypothetical protein